jgi:Tfp pilus assembly protein PilE
MDLRGLRKGSALSRRGRAIVSQDGFTIVEVLVAATILIVGVLTALSALDSSRRLTLVAERRTSMVHRAQLELERVKSLPYSQIALSGSSSQWSTNTGDYSYVSNPAGTCPGAPSGAAPTYQPDHSSGGSTGTEPLLINGCSYTINGSATAVSAGTVAPVTTWSDGRLGGNIYDFVTWTNDSTCSNTSSPGSICSTSNDYKRVTIVVTLNGAALPSKPAIVSAYVADPNATPPGAPANSQQNPLHSPSTSCLNSQGQTVSCSNTLNGTPVQYFLSDTPYQSPYGSPSCSGNNEHQTLVNFVSGLLTPPSPDQLVTGLPPGGCTDSSGNPTPPCFALNIGCGSGSGGLPFVPNGGATCGSPPADNTKSHSWLTPQIPAGTTMNLNGTGSMTTYLQSGTGVAVNATVCMGLYVVPGGLLGSLAGNLLAQPIGATVSASVTAAAGVPTPVSFNFNVGSTASVSSTILNLARVELVVWVAASAGTKVSLVYDQAQFASQVTLVTT